MIFKKNFLVLGVISFGYLIYAPLFQTSDTPVFVGEAPLLVQSARDQIGVTRYYDPAYVGLSYPDGDLPIETGVCTDVVVRALRDAHAIDLQKEIHEDMQNNFASYPDRWGLTQPDTNIDHRRVPNIQHYFSRKGYELKVTDNPANYQAGDIVTSVIANRPHIMIVGNKQNSDGIPYVIHNVGRGTQEENFLFAYPITGHYRVI